MIINNRYEIVGGPVAVQWNDDLAAQFPNAEHHGCRIRYHIDLDGHFRPIIPTQCVGLHCPHCGNPCGYTGHIQCLNQPTPGEKFA